MEDEDDNAQGLSPTSLWRKNGKRKEYSNDEEEEEEQEDSLNIELVREAKKDPIPIASGRVIPSPTTPAATKPRRLATTYGKIHHGVPLPPLPKPSPPTSDDNEYIDAF
jgi:hypothetical protein